MNTLRLALALTLFAATACEEEEDFLAFDQLEDETSDTLDYADDLPQEFKLASGNLVLNDVYSTSVSAGSSGTKMYSTATTSTVLKLLAPKAALKIVIATPNSGRYRVHHAGVLGWIAAADLTFNYSYQNNLPLSQVRINALARAREAMGFSYWWSNGKWNPNGGATMGASSTKGHCSGDCEVSCTHTATGGGVQYGADCAGFVSTIWGFPDFDPMTNPENNGFTAGRYYQANPSWTTVSVANALPGDAWVSTVHIYLTATRRDAAGYLWSYECVSCQMGCRTMRRSVPLSSTTAHMIRRVGW